MAQPALQPASYEDVLNTPEHLVAEIINGQLQTHPRPAPRHAVAYSSLGDELVSPFGKGKGGPGGWWILDEPELHLSGHVLVPDLAGWRRERMPRLPDTAWFELSPDWVCEILSPSTARLDRIEKMPLYADQGVRQIWLVDPELRTLEAFENREGQWTMIAALEEDNPVSVPPFDAITFDLSLLWAE
jgi:Uma2 family endonuclease